MRVAFFIFTGMLGGILNFQVEAVIISAETALKMQANGARVVDVRKYPEYKQAHVKDAVHSYWREFQHNDGSGAVISNLQTLSKKLQALGISKQQNVVVYADTRQGWGEDGHFVWLLKAVGHKKVYMVNGGWHALLKVGARTDDASVNVLPGDFAAQPLQFRVSTLELQKNRSRYQLVDSRESIEFAGATPYGEKRGGHIPGAISLYFKVFLDDKGYILPRKKIQQILKTAGLSQDRPVAAYCTGGVRSGFLFVILEWAGYSAFNYDASMWEWSAQNNTISPLEKI